MVIENKKQWIASSLFFLSIVAISTSAIFAKFTIASPTVLSMYRLLFACMLLSPMVVNKRKEISKIEKKEWISFAGAGFFLAMHFSLWYGSLVYTSIASSTIILALQPIIALIGGYLLFREKVSSMTMLCMFIAIIGAIMIGWGDLGLSKQAIFGDFLSFISVIMVVCYLLIGQKMVKNISHWIYTFFVFGFATITLMVINVISRQSFFHYTLQDWIIFVCLAVIPSCAMVIHNWLMKEMTATTISMGILGEPVGASALAFLILGELLAVSQWMGGILVIIGVFLFLMNQTKGNKGIIDISKAIGEQ